MAERIKKNIVVFTNLAGKMVIIGLADSSLSNRRRLQDIVKFNLGLYL